MTTDMHVISVMSALGLAALSLFVFYFWRDYRLDVFRENLFNVRDALFLYALDNGIEFNDPAYSILRERMNIMLRFAHELDLTRLLLVATLQPFSTENPDLLTWEMAVDALPSDPVKMRLREFRDRFVLVIFEHILLLSFPRFMVLRPIRALVQVRTMIKHRVLPKATPGIEQLESEALEEENAYRRKDEVFAVATR